MNEWSTMKKLIWLKRTALGGIPFVWKTESGEAPLTLEGALANSVRSLTQYGLCTQASTPTPTDPVPIVCNNGTLKWDSVNQRVYADGTPESISITASGADTQTATAENLLSVGDYADEQEVISGAVTRKVEMLVINGTEDWGYYGDNVFAATGVLMDMDEGADDIGICTHYEVGDTCNIYNGEFDIWDERFSTVSEFTAFLAAQYAAGTPVVVLYPLAESTTESVTPQPLETADGDNTISVSANVSPISLKAEYAGVSV